MKVFSINTNVVVTTNLPLGPCQLFFSISVMFQGFLHATEDLEQLFHVIYPGLDPDIVMGLKSHGLILWPIWAQGNVIQSWCCSKHWLFKKLWKTLQTLFD